MRAKFRISKIEKWEGGETLTFNAVCPSNGYGPNGESEDNDFARWTPYGELKMSVTNPALLNKFSEGEVFYLDFTKAEEPVGC